jgi:hypothetical protein
MIRWPSGELISYCCAKIFALIKKTSTNKPDKDFFIKYFLRNSAKGTIRCATFYKIEIKVKEKNEKAGVGRNQMDNL